MACLFCDCSDKDGQPYCELGREKIDENTLARYCSDEKAYEDCPTYVRAEVLTEQTCQQILSCFGEAVNAVQEGMAGYAMTVAHFAAKCDYLPIHDACRILEDPPQIPRCNGTYRDMVNTEQERQLAEELDSAMEDLLSAMRKGISYEGGGVGAYPCVSPADIKKAAGSAEYYYAFPLVDYMDNLYVPAKPEKYGEAAQRLARECSSALRVRLAQVDCAMDMAAQDLESGMNSTAAAAEQDRGWVLRDAGIHWEVE